MEMLTIQIAPKKDEVFYNEENSSIYTSFAGGITYVAENLYYKYNKDYLCECFQTAIALTSRREQLEYLMNKHLNLNGRVL